jgi:hypothetical protein
MDREEAVRTLLNISEAVGANGLGLPWSMVQSAPEDVRTALLALGVTEDEIHRADTLEES